MISRIVFYEAFNLPRPIIVAHDEVAWVVILTIPLGGVLIDRIGHATTLMIASQAREPNSGLIVMPDSFLVAHRVEVTSLAARHHLPAVYPFRFWAERGGLLSYGNDQRDNYRRAATYVDRILRGAKPSELPVQAPVKFELVINLKTAKALGFTVPPTLIARADEVIE